jgi:GntR family transcriptional regulator
LIFIERNNIVWGGVFAIKPVDKKISLPLYYQIEAQIKQQIRNGQLKLGDKLPTELWFSETYNVSRVTVRKTFSELIAKGIIERVRGKSPTIANSKFNRQTNRLTGLHEALAQNGILATSKLLNVECKKSTDYVMKMLQIGSPEMLIEVQRIRFADGKPICLQTINLREKYCKGLDIKLLEESSLYKILENDLHLEISYAQQTVSSKNASKREAEQLEIKAAGPIMHVKRTTFLSNGESIEFSDNFYAADRYTLSMTLCR